MRMKNIAQLLLFYPRGLLIVVFDQSRHTQVDCSSLQSCTTSGCGRVSLSWFKCSIPSKPWGDFICWYGSISAVCKVTLWMKSRCLIHGLQKHPDRAQLFKLDKVWFIFPSLFTLTRSNWHTAAATVEQLPLFVATTLSPELLWDTWSWEGCGFDSRQEPCIFLWICGFDCGCLSDHWSEERWCKLDGWTESCADTVDRWDFRLSSLPITCYWAFFFRVQLQISWIFNFIIILLRLHLYYKLLYILFQRVNPVFISAD